MCVIINCFNKKPNHEMIKRCHEANSDGAGIMWFNEDGKVQYVKGLDNPDKVSELVEKLELPFVLHFRSASIGGKSPLLTHPFEMTPNSELKLDGICDKALVHNGTVGDWDLFMAAAAIDKPIGEPLSDSRAIAMITGRNNNEKFLEKIKGNYVVANCETKIFNTYGDFRESQFTDEKGMTFSNFTWRYKNTPTTTKTYNNHHHYGGMTQSDNKWEGEGGATVSSKTTVSTPISDSSKKTEEIEAWWIAQLTD